MHSTMITTAVLFASAAFAVPVNRNNGSGSSMSSNYNSGSDSKVRVTLSNQAIELGSTASFTGLSREEKRATGGGPFATIEVTIGADNPNQALRCQALDAAGTPLVADRGANTDITFADGGNGPWTFKEPSKISKIICDPAFKKGDASAQPAPEPAVQPEAFEVRIKLSDQGAELGTQTTFETVEEPQESRPVGSSGPYETVELVVGELGQQDLRCQILDNAGEPIVVLRNGNRDVTFADGDAGEWKLEQKSEVSKIVCDPSFVKGSA